MKLNLEVMCSCGSGNAVRYIDDHGELCCGICPIKNGRDSIRISDVPQLLGWARITIEYLKGRPGNGHVPAGDSIQAMLGQRAAIVCTDESCDKTCNCHNKGWGGHSTSLCRHLSAALDTP